MNHSTPVSSLNPLLPPISAPPEKTNTDAKTLALSHFTLSNSRPIQLDDQRRSEANTIKYLAGNQRIWSCQEALEMCALLYSQKKGEEAKNLFFSRVLSHFINGKESCERQISLFLKGEESSKKMILIDLLKKVIFDNSSLILRLPPQVIDWVRENKADRAESYVIEGYFHHYIQKNEPEAFSAFQEAARLGSPVAHLEMGHCYSMGLGTEQNHEKAYVFYETAANLGSSLAHVAIGHCYAMGRGVMKNDELAFHYYQKAAQLGCGLGYVEMGSCHLLGIGAPQNDQEALRCFNEAIHFNSADGFVKMGDCYYLNLGVAQDKQKAFEFYRRGAFLGASEGFVKMGDHYWLAPEFSEQKKAILFYENGADLGSSHAFYKIGDSYWTGRGIGKNKEKAYEFYKKAAQLGSLHAWNAIGFCHWQGEGTDRNEIAALHCFQKAYQMGSKEGQLNLAKLLSSDVKGVTNTARSQSLLSELMRDRYPGAATFYANRYF